MDRKFDKPKQLLKILNDCTDYLSARGVNASRLQAELLLAHVLKMSRLELYLQFEKELTCEELDELRPMLKRRGERVPLQHIVGEVEFCGLMLELSPAALIPRPETEILVELAYQELKDLSPGLVYDVGTGSGAIALALAHRLPEWHVVATDISPAALELAKRNHARYPERKVTWHQMDLLEGMTEPAALVVANLPYLTIEEMNHLQPEVKADPTSALHGGEDGLDLVRELLPQAAKLAPSILLEVGIGHTDHAAELAREAGFLQATVLQDLTERPRFILAKR